MNGHERTDRAALVAARLALAFRRDPWAQLARVYLSPNGHVMVRVEAGRVLRADREVIGVYDRSVSIGQIVDDVTEFERASGR